MYRNTVIPGCPTAVAAPADDSDPTTTNRKKSTDTRTARTGSSRSGAANVAREARSDWRHGDRHDAEELVQDCFVRAYRALATYPPTRIRELRLRGWLTTILLNAGRNRARVKRVPTTELTFEPGAEPAVDPLTRRDERETWARLLAGLTSAQRTAVVLRHVDGMSYAEIAEATGRPEGTVKAHVHRGLAALRTALLAAERREREEIPA